MAAILTSFVYLCVSVISSLFVFGTCSSFATWLSSQTLWLRKSDSPVITSLIVDLLLVLLFIVQHHYMAAKSYKEWFTSLGLGVLERPTYNFTTAIALQMMMWLWQPLPEYHYSLWLFETYKGGLLWLFFFLLHLICWLVLILQVFSFEPLELLGVQQVWYHLNDWKPPLFYKNKYLQRLYRHMRHPGVTAFLIILWVHPNMMLDRYVLATLLTIYLMCAHGVVEEDYIYLNESVNSGHFFTWQKVLRIERKYE